MLHLIAQIAGFVLPVVVGGAIVAIGLIFVPPTYHWDGKVSAEPRR